MKKLFLFSLLIALFFLGCEKEKTIVPSGKVVRVGILAPFSGDDKRLGHQGLSGLQAANEINRYLDNGDEIVLENFDTKSDSNHTSKALAKIADSKNFTALISLMASNNTLSLIDDFTKHKIPTIATLATNNNISSNDGYISQVSIDNKTQVLIAAHYMKDEKFIKNVGVIYDKSNVYSIEIANDFKKYYKDIGGKIEFFVDINTEQGFNEFKSIDKSNIKMLFNAVNADKTIHILKLIKKQNFTFDILGTDGLLSSALELPQEDLKYFNGLYVIEHFADDTEKNAERILLESHLDKNDFKATSFAFLAYDSYQLLLLALNSCVGYEKKCVNAIFKNSGIIHSALGDFSMINSHAKREVFINKIEDSKLSQEVIIY